MKTKKSYLVQVRELPGNQVTQLHFSHIVDVHDYLNEIELKPGNTDFQFTISTINSFVCEDNNEVCDK